MSIDAPTSIGKFCSTVGIGNISDTNFVIRNLTSFNYMVSYTEAEERIAYMDKMVAKKMPGIGTTIGRSTLLPLVRGLRYCRSCFSEDLNKRPVGE